MRPSDIGLRGYPECPISIDDGKQLAEKGLLPVKVRQL